MEVEKESQERLTGEVKSKSYPTRGEYQCNRVGRFILEVLLKSGHPVEGFICSQLNRYRLDRSFKFDVLHEVFERSLNCKDSIEVPEAWVKGVSLNVIKEMRRSQDRFQGIELDDARDAFLLKNEYRDEEDILVKGLPLSDYEPKLAKAFNSLSKKNGRILFLKYVEGLSWNQVAAIISEEGKPIKESAIRKQGNRALKFLRDNVHQ